MHRQQTSPAAGPRRPTKLTRAAAPTKILLYQNLISFLQDACKAARSDPDAGIQRLLKEYSVSMASDNIVQVLTHSLENKRTLLDLSSQLGLAADPSLRECLRADEEAVVLALEGDPAQGFLDVVQEALDRGALIDQEHARTGRRIVRKLSEACDKLPSSLFITQVIERETHPSFGGGFGDVYRARYEGQNVALKHMRHFLRGAQLREIRLRLCREALVWKDLNHPNILPFIGIDRETFPNSLCMISPWMENGTVLKYLDVHGRANVNKLLFEIVQGIQYLHSRNIVHGDLRGANILIKEDWVACLADFGLSSFTDTTSKTHTSNRAGSTHWMAPELIDPDRFGLKFIRTPASDVYAFGCVCFELYTGRPPFSELSETAALFRVIGGERAQRPIGELPISHELWSAITTCWAGDPASRPTIDVVFQNPIWPIPKLESIPEWQDVQVTLEPVPVLQKSFQQPQSAEQESKSPEVSKRRRFKALGAFFSRSSPTAAPPQNTDKVKSPPAPVQPPSPSDSVVAVYNYSKSPPAKVFGVPLEKSLIYASTQISIGGENGTLREWGFVPNVIAKCGLYLKERAIEEPWIFHPNNSDDIHIQQLKALFDQPPQYGKSLNWEEMMFTVYDVVNVFLAFLNELPEPLISFKMYISMRDVMDNTLYDKDEIIAEYKPLIHAMPTQNLYLLLYVLDLLAVFARKSAKNMMKADKLAAIFRYALFRDPANSSQSIRTLAHELDEMVVQFLIANMDWFMLPVPGVKKLEEDAGQITFEPSKFKKVKPRGGLGRGVSVRAEKLVKNLDSAEDFVNGR